MALRSLLILICFSVTVRAQYNTEFSNYASSGRSVRLFLEFDAGSNGMSSSLINRLVWGGHIDDDLKRESTRHLRAKNNFGINVNYGLCTFVKGNSKVDYLIGFKNQEVLNASYTSDFFNLMFYGNKMYKGHTANLAGSNVNALRFQEIKFGAIFHRFDSVAKIGVSVSFLKGEQLFYMKAHKNSTLFTSGDGNELIFNSHFSMALSDTSNKRLASFNGVGASADIFFETPYKSKLGTRSVLVVNANNIGFIHWRNQSVQYNSDSTLRFSGYQVNNILDLKDSAISRINSDSLLRSLTNARREPFNVNIPTNLLIINKIYFGAEKLSLSTGFRHIFNANFIPYIFLEPEYRWRKFTFGVHTGYGGYVRLNVGASFSYNSSKWNLRLGSNSLQGYLFPHSVSGQGLFFSFARKFK